MTLPRPQRPTPRLAPPWIVALSLIIYVFIFVPLYQRFGQPATLLGALPVAVTAWLIGLWPAMGLQFLILAVNVYLYVRAGMTGPELTYTIAVDAVAGTLWAGVIGTLSDQLQRKRQEVAERLRVEAALSASEQRYRQLVDLAQEGIWALDANYRTTFANPRMAEMVGYGVDEMPGTPLLHFIPADYVARTYENLARRRRGISERVETPLTRKDGSLIYVSMAVGPIFDAAGQYAGSLAVVADVTERRRAAAALAASQETLRQTHEELTAIIAAAPLPIMTLDTAGRVTLWNQAAAHTFGWPTEEVMGRPNPTASPDAQGLFHSRIQAILDGQDLTGATIHAIRRDGAALELDLHATVLRDAAGAPRGILAMMVDVTEQRKADEALRQRQKLESVGLLAGGVAHDFNNLLTAILAQSSLARSLLPADAPAVKHIGRAVSAAEQAAALTRQLLAYAGKGRFHIEPTDLNQVIETTVALLDAAIPKSVTLHRALAADLPPIAADRAQMQQVIMNLVVNGAEAIPANSPNHDRGVTISTGRETLGSPAGGPSGAADGPDIYWEGNIPLPPGEYAWVCVSDTGSGMDAETVARIFDPFFTTKFTGRGLGLAAVLGIIRGHHGALRIRTRPGEGSAFTVYLPVVAGTAAPRHSDPPLAGSSGIPAEVVTLAAPPAAGHPAENAPDQPPPPAAAPRRTILVIDDERPVREALADILELEGWTALTAANGREGVALFRRHQAEIALVLLDLLMPVMGGDETLAALRAIDPQVKVILSSGYDEAEAARCFASKNIANGAHGVHTKGVRCPGVVSPHSHRDRSVVTVTWPRRTPPARGSGRFAGRSRAATTRASRPDLAAPAARR
jgi:PAS domain S-box-containing protein